MEKLMNEEELNQHKRRMLSFITWKRKELEQKGGESNATDKRRQKGHAKHEETIRRKKGTRGFLR
jgi:hypothetical protein